MTKDINQINIVGNLVADPKITDTENSYSATLLVATGKFERRPANQIVDNNDEPYKHTSIHEVRVCVSHIVEHCRNLRKGDRVVIYGEVRHTQNGKSHIILLAPHARFYKVE